MKVAIVDDNKKWQDEIKQNILNNKFFEVDELYEFESGEEFIKSGSDFSVVFMDIEMSGMDGFSAIQKYKTKHRDTKFIITTTHTELSRRGYQVEAFRYIDKIHMKEEMEEALEAVIKLFRQEKSVSIVIENYGNRKFKIKDIIYFETQNRKLLMHTVNDIWLCNENISDMEERLRGDGFYMSHRSYLVNLRYVKELVSTKVILQNGEEVFLSRRKYSDLKDKYMEYKFGEANQ